MVDPVRVTCCTNRRPRAAIDHTDAHAAICRRGSPARLTMPAYLGIAIDAPMRRLFDYLPPAGIEPEALRPGQRLWVPFGRRRCVGILVEQRDTTDVPVEKLRRAHELIDAEPVFEPVLFGLLQWAAHYYRHPIGEVFASALPLALREGGSMIESVDLWQLTELGRSDALSSLGSRAKKLRALVSALADGPLTAEQLSSLDSSWRVSMRALRERGYVQALSQPQSHIARAAIVQAGAPELSSAQQAAVEAIEQQAGRFETLLLYGITGSGKTEVYLRAIERTLARGDQSLVLVPEIALTPQLIDRFRRRFDAPIAVLHSSLNESEKLQAWRDARTGRASIVIGTRSAVFAPLDRPGLIVIDEEHDPSYKQQEGFRYSARDLAIMRAQRHCIPIVLGSATPSLESLANTRSGRSTVLHLPTRAANAQEPRWSVIDLRRHASTQGISTPTMQTMQRHLDAGGQVLLYLNRRGYAPALFCPACGWSASCRRCDARMTLHRNEGRLRCHHCGVEEPVPLVCGQCHAEVKPVGQGTERIEETLSQLFPGVPLARIDRDAVRRKGALEHALDQVNRGELRILIGTQMLAKGHHFPLVTLVVVLNADQGLFGTDFRASERLAQTIVQVAGRAGRAERAGEVMIQTEFPEHPLLQRLVREGYAGFADAALIEREAAGWPPCSRLALIRAEASQMDVPLMFLAQARDRARASGAKGVSVFGPAPAPMERRAGKYRAQLLLQAANPGPLQRLFDRWLAQIESLPDAKRVRWSIDVDPIELF